MIGLKATLLILFGLISFVNCGLENVTTSVQLNSTLKEATTLSNGGHTTENVELLSTVSNKGESSTTEKNKEIEKKVGKDGLSTKPPGDYKGTNFEENEEGLESEEGIMNQEQIYEGEINDNALEEERSDKFGEYFPPKFQFKSHDNLPPNLVNTLSETLDNTPTNPMEETIHKGGESPDKKYLPQVEGHFDSLTHNCTVFDVSKGAEISTPYLDRIYKTETLKVKKIVLKDYCYESASTVCTQSERIIPNQLCKIAYERKQEHSIIKSVKVYYKKEASTKWVTVCKNTYQHKVGYHDGYGKPVCKEVSQRIAFNTPVLTPDNIPVIVSYPAPVRKCVNGQIILPLINCKTKTEKKCIHVPDVVDEIKELKVCSYKLGKPKWIPIDLKLPKQICAEIVKAY
uniref:SRCR domain-containing protein n=1 Tax=Lepeophtheirus salmonis TaxID=72036 RepID=A0A0K2V5C8_LEPSM